MEITNVGVLSGARFGVPMGQSSLVLEAAGSVLRVFNPVAAETVRVALAAGGLASVSGFASHGAARVGVTVDGVAGSLAADLVACARLAAGTGMTGYLAAANLSQMQAVQVMAVTVGGAEYLLAARPAGSGIEAFRIAADGALLRVSGVADTVAIAAAGIGAMASAVVGGKTVVFAASGGEHGITAVSLGEGGVLAVIEATGAPQGVPVQGITCLKTVEVGGATWLIAGAAGSSSLTVFRIGAEGAMQPVDHVIDDLATRFDGITALDAVVVGGRVFVVVAGADDGISLLTLLPDGALVHLATLADSAATGLTNVSDLRLSVVGGVLQVFALSGGEAGLTQLSVDLRGLGVVGDSGTAGDDLLVCAPTGGAVSGGGGRDILLDGAGTDTLAGGAGADLFVLVADGRLDVIADFDIALDRIDLTRWGFFRNAGQLQITATATGAVLRFAGETLELRSADGKTLTEVALRALGYGAMTRLPVGDAVPVVVQPEPLPVVGTAGNDTLAGTAGAEVLSGLGGDDVIVAGGGADTVFGGAGRDWLSYAASNVAVRIDLGRWADGSADVADDRVDGVEGFIGSALGDVMTGAAGAALFRGGAGDDTLATGTGSGDLDGGEGDDSLTGGAGADVLWGGAGADIARGGDGNDALDGGIGNDRLYGGVGLEQLVGGEGDDWIDGGDGVDAIADGAGNDTVYGGAGNESIVATAGNDWLYGDEGEDALDGGIGNDRLYGGVGLDRLVGGEGDDWIEGGDGVDAIADGAGNDTVYGGAGNESIVAIAGNDWIFGDDGADMLDGGVGDDRLFGGAASDLLLGGAGNDTLDGGTSPDGLNGGSGDDEMAGGGGNDRLTGLAGNDRLYGGEGDDLLNGGAGDDVLEGGAGNDRLSASIGNDSLRGDEGDDLLAGLFGTDDLEGGTGRDTLDGGRGNDRVFGGAGADVFLFASFAAGEVDVIGDFEDGIDRVRMLGVAGTTDAARFKALAIRDVTVAGVDYAEITRFGHIIRLEGIAAADLTAADFLFV